MITAHRTHRHFNIDRYLAEQLAQQSEEKRQEAYPANGKDFNPLRAKRSSPSAQDFRGWAVRLNARIERWMDAHDWSRLEIWIGNLSGVFLTGFILYMAYVVTDAWLQGRLNLGAN